MTKQNSYFELWQKAEGAEKTKLYRSHKSEIRAGASLASSAGAKHVLDQWCEATGSEKTVLWRAHKTDIRAEADRRAQVGNN